MSANVKDQLRELADQLPEHATWEDVMQKAYERQAIEAGLQDSLEGRVIPVQEVRAEYGLK